MRASHLLLICAAFATESISAGLRVLPAHPGSVHVALCGP